MKTLAYAQLDCLERLYVYKPYEEDIPNCLKRNHEERIQEAMKRVKPLHNIAVYYIHGSQRRLIFIHEDILHKLVRNITRKIII